MNAKHCWFTDRESRLLHISLTRDRRLLDKHIESMKETCDQMMVNKFGRLVSLEKLETVIVNRELEELRQQLHDHQLSSEMELFRWQVGKLCHAFLQIIVKLQSFAT